MKTMKTAVINRKIYVYDSATGKKDVLYPGFVDPLSGHVFTEEDIRMLHSSDDAEVYNNLKNTKPKVQPWEEADIEAWKEDHPGEDLPSRVNLSLDDLLDSDEGEADEDKCGTLGRVSMLAYEMETSGNALVERMREVVMEMGESYWRLYVLHTINGYTFEEVAKEMGMGCTTVKDRFTKIKEMIKCKL